MKPHEIHSKKSSVWDFGSKGLVVSKSKKTSRREAKQQIKIEVNQDYIDIQERWDFICDNDYP